MVGSEQIEKDSSRGFFHIDARTWKLLCGRGDIDQAVSYLVIAAGTDTSNRVSRWSAQAVETYTGLHNRRAKAAIAELISAGYLRRNESSQPARPVYGIEPFRTPHEIAIDVAKANGASELVWRATSGQGWDEKVDGAAAAPYLFRGILWRFGNLFRLPDYSEDSDYLIWLPNSLVTGVGKKTSPVRRLRSAGDLSALRLLVDLYRAQNLSADFGISRLTLRHEYSRKQYGKRGRHVAWGFSEGETIASKDPVTEAFWEAASMTGKYMKDENKIWNSINTLIEMGLLTCVPHLAENSRKDCELMHGFGSKGIGEDIERELAEAAESAAQSLIGKNAVTCAKWMERVDFMVPVWDTQTDVQMIGVYRLTYRPHTTLTADWMRRLRATAEEYLEIYGALVAQGERAAERSLACQ